MFTVIYRYLPSPSAQVTWRAAGMAGTIVALLWELAKQGFAFYLHRFANYNKVYGSIGTVMILMLIIYFNSLILLIGYELNVSIHHLRVLAEERALKDAGVNGSPVTEKK